ncbi:phosducin-like protein isoform X2 [Pollicipes pollicipes]|uniref:phosducin-like protein isoform X2 n=1 Tax=Pollicipes pollicipes TaxID=41117 RepID=UPI0018851ECD|nr:phosducin-like protein isoform X2 [Pollicipes pollicipes]
MPTIRLAMATLDDKLLGEKLQYYCSSSEDEGADSADEGAGSGDEGAPAAAEPAAPPPPGDAWAGSSTNTGPKGVIKDWQRFKQLEAEKRAAQSLEKMQLAKKLTMTCRSHLEDDREKREQQQLEEELGMLEDDEVLREFIQRRMQEMAAVRQHGPKFGHLIALDSAEHFLDAVDQEEKDVIVIVHVYDERTPSCCTMNACLATVSQQYPGYKFCKLRASTAGVSRRFSDSGVPALIAYKAGAVIGNFVRMEDELGDDFCAGDVENFLIEHGLLQDRSCAPACIRSKATDSDDSD